MTLAALRTVPLFEGIAAPDVASLAGHLTRSDHRGPRVLLREGDRSEEFLILVSGEAVVTIGAGAGTRRLATVGAGSVLGEVGLLTGRDRMATVTTMGPSTVLAGGRDACEQLLAHPLVHDRLLELARRRLAADMTPVAVLTPRGSVVLLRPILPTDRQAMVEAIRSASAETLQRRFLSGGPPSSSMVDYLVRVDYVDHFAWVALDPLEDDQPIAVGRYVRLRVDPGTAEVAFTVADPAQGHGLGTLLLGAVGAVAGVAGIGVFVASVRHDNRAMLRVLGKAEAHVEPEAPGVTHAVMDVDRAAALLDDQTRHRLREAARALVTTTG